MHNRSASPDDGFVRPMGVTIAEERAREARIIEERHAQNARILAEMNRIAYGKPVANPATCEHKEINVFQSFGSSIDDHETSYGECRACKTWVVSTLHFGGGDHIETRPMVAAELDRFAAMEERRRHDEWSWDA